MGKLGATYMAFPGHKGLLGPQGTGVLLCGRVPNPLLVGGSGSESRSMYMPEILPDRLEAGTHNVPGIAGLLAGVRYVRRVGVEQIGKIERERMERLFRYVSRVNEVETFYSEDASKQGGILSVRHKGMDSEMLAQKLSEAGVAVRGGLHCAPSAHETVGTLDGGTVRFSFSPYTTEQDVFYGYSTLKKSVNKEKT
jgi:selenocysteine lyase/cysteine desulfurase